MNDLIIVLAVINILFLFMHELDACYRKEWMMLKFLKFFKEKTQYLIFIYFHIPLTLFAFYYLWTVINFNNFTLWIIVNLFGVLHLIIHLFALKWQSNVFKNVHSFIFIVGEAVTGLIGLFLISYY